MRTTCAIACHSPSRQPARMVGARGFEPPTSCSQSRRATRLRYAPLIPASIPRARAPIPCQGPARGLQYTEPDPRASSGPRPAARKPTGFAMARRSLGLDDRLYEYLVSQGTRETDVQRRLREETRANVRAAGMQIGPDQAQAMGLLVRLIGARRALEIGTFTGYSALAVALALPADGRLVCCDVNAEWTAIARRYWQEAGVAAKIDLHLAPALETLAALRRDGADGRFDFAFIDADKDNYDAYYEACLALVRRGGLIA